MYSTCLNENASALPNDRSLSSMNNGLMSNDPSMLNIDLGLLEAALKDVTASNRSLTSSTTFASNQLIAAANAARSVQQKQQSVSSRTNTGSGNLSAGVHSKGNMPSSTLASPTPNTFYPSLLQEKFQQSSSIVKLLHELTKQQASKTCGKDNINNDTGSLTDTQFLTPKAMDIITSRVS